MQFLKCLVQRYDAATLFVVAATAVVALELSVMRILVPAPANGDDVMSGTLMAQICSPANLEKSSESLDVWERDTERYIERFTLNPEKWQKELLSMHAFNVVEIKNEVILSSTDSRKEHLLAADYAAENLELQSVMTGRTTLANINGNIYREGETISMRGGEILMRIVELGSTYAVLEHAEHDVDGDTRRTIHIADNMRLANGNRQ